MYPYFSGECGARLGCKSVPTRHYSCKEGTIKEYRSRDAIKEAIQKEGPVESLPTIYSDFMNYKRGIY